VDPAENVAHGKVIVAYSVGRGVEASAFEVDWLDSPVVRPEEDGVDSEPDALEQF
jgi:hypothetical protein